MVESRLLSSDDAAVYLGLGSRWATYRVIAQHAIPVVRLAGKLLLDRQDLDVLVARFLAAMAPPMMGMAHGRDGDGEQPGEECECAHRTIVARTRAAAATPLDSVRDEDLASMRLR